MRVRSSSSSKVRRLGAVLLLVVVAGGCGDDAEPAVKPPDDSIPEVSDKTMDRQLKVTVSGERTATYDGVRPMRFVVRPGSGANKTFSVASVTVVEPVDIAGGMRMNPEIGIAGMYERDGTFTIPAGIGQAPTSGPTVPNQATGSTGVSVAQVTFIASAPPGEVRFGYLLEPCQVTTSAGATEGTAKCPALVAVSGQRVSLDLSWGPPR